MKGQLYLNDTGIPLDRRKYTEWQKAYGIARLQKGIGPEKDIREIKNTIAVYDQLDKLDGTRLTSFLKGHVLLRNGLAPLREVSGLRR